MSESDIGFEKFSETDKAKESSNIVITDNNYSSLLIEIIFGKNKYDNTVLGNFCNFN